MKALVVNGLVTQVEPTEFEVHPDFVWVDCPDDVEAGFAFADGVFIPLPKPLPRTYAELRAKEYPPMADYLDAVVKGDQAQIDKYISDCLAVKAKYPKPTVE